MKLFTREYILLIVILALLTPIFVLFIFHDIYIGTDEIRITYVAKEIVNMGQVYFTDTNNSIYNTDIFVKNAFLMNSNKIIYPAGFTINSLILVPVLSLAPDPILIFNIFALLCYLLSFLIIYKIFVSLGLKYYYSIVGALIYSLTNFYFALYVSYYPDSLLLLFCLLFIFFIIRFEKTKNRNCFYMVQIIGAFMLAYKVTMYPVIFTFLPLYFIHVTKSKKINFKIATYAFALFLFTYIVCNVPQLITSKIGPTYNELSNVTDSSQQSPSTTGNTSKSSPFATIEHLTDKFYYDFLLPKGNGIYLEQHLIKDFQLLSSNNIIFIFGFLFSSILFYKKDKKVLVITWLVFITSFILWGNMNVYGGGGVYDLGDLRNTHVRYMMPIFVLFYIVGFYYLFDIVKNKYILASLLSYVLITTFVSMTSDYPFSNYSLVNKKGFFYDYRNEKENITNLHLPQNSIFVSASFDDYDLSYDFANYADFKLLSNKPKDMAIMLKKFTNGNNKNVYLLFPIKDSRFNPIKQQDLDSLYKNITTTYSSKIIYSDGYKQLLRVSQK